MSETHDIVPDGVDADVLRGRAMKTPKHDRQIERCPRCGYASLRRRKSGPTDRYCERCHDHVEAVVAESIEAAQEAGR